jgi:phenylpyruvate tautomerase PptA (4-oxalocrotonate tautomerase family)
MMTVIIDAEQPMPMIDVYAETDTFPDPHSLAQELAAAVMRWEKVPNLRLFRKNTAAFVHDLPKGSISNVDGEGNYVRVQVLTPAGVLDREKQLGVVRELTSIVAKAAVDPTLADRTWVLIYESPDGGWGIQGHANTGADIATAARAEIASRGPG